MDNNTELRSDVVRSAREVADLLDRVAPDVSCDIDDLGATQVTRAHDLGVRHPLTYWLGVYKTIVCACGCGDVTQELWLDEEAAEALTAAWELA